MAAKWTTVQIKDVQISEAERERDRIAGLQRVYQHMGKRKGKLPDFDRMAQRIEPVIDMLRAKDESNRLLDNI